MNTTPWNDKASTAVLHRTGMAALSLLFLLLAACGGGGGDTTVPTPAPTEGSATLDAAGGTVQGPDGVSLSIPAQALDAGTTLRIARDSTGAPELLGMGLASPIYAVTPHGTSFATSALLQLPFDASKIPSGATPVVLRGEPDGTWHVQPLTSIRPGVAAVDVSSLSWYAVGVCTPGDAGVLGFGTGDCPANSTLLLESVDTNGKSIPIPRDANGNALPFPELTAPTDVVLRITWTRPDGVDRNDSVFLTDLVNGETSNAPFYSKTFFVHLDPTKLPGAANIHGVVKKYFATVQYCRYNVDVFGVGKRDVCWTFDTDIAFRVHDTNPAPAAPVITEQPANASVIADQQVTYRVSATAPNPLYIQWQRWNPTTGNWQAARLVSGALPFLGSSTPGTTTGASGTVAGGPAVANPTDNSTPGNASSIVNGTQSFWFIPVASDVGAQFRALVCDGSVSGNRTCTYSNAAVLDYLTDGRQPWWTLVPVDTNVQAGTTASFTVNANGYYLAPSVAIHVKTPAGTESIHTCPYTPGSNYATSCTATTGVLGTADTGTQVWAEAWIDQAKTSLITSRTATLTVGSVAVAPSISSQPVATTAALGGTASFSVGAGGTAPLSYQWRFNGVALSDHLAGSSTSGLAGSSSPMLALTNVQSGDVGNYSVVVSNGTAPNVASSDAGLAISPGPMGSGTGSVIALSAGSYHNCAIQSDHTLVCWGANSDGQLGDGTTTSRSTPRQVPHLGNVVAVAAGTGHTCAAKSDGTVACWGLNDAGQLGDGTTVAKLSPTVVPNLTGVLTLAAGSTHTCASKDDGTVACWGENSRGQLGDGSGINRLSPVAVVNLHQFPANPLLVAGIGYTCAVNTFNGPSCWGSNDVGQLGDGSTTYRYVPVAISGATSVVALAAGINHTCAAQGGGIGGTVVCWGGNTVGQLGDGTTTDKSSPTAIPNLSQVVALAGGYVFSCAATASGAVKCWGYNHYGNLGDGTGIDRLSPVDVPGLTGVVAVSAGIYHACAVKSDGSVACWGGNGWGQAGDGTYTDHLSPVYVAF